MIQIGLAAIVAILAISAVLLFVNLPDGDAFNSAIREIFVNRPTSATPRRNARCSRSSPKPAPPFSGVLASYRAVMFVLMVFAAALLIACLVFLVTIVTLNRRIGEIERRGIQVSSMILSREERVVLINNLGVQADRGGDGNALGSCRGTA